MMNRPHRPNRPQKTPPQPDSPPLGNYAFIDSQNLNLGVQKIGWKMDWRRFRLWLQEKYNVTHAFMFIGYMAENESLYELMHEHGYLIVLKPTLEIKAKPEEEQPPSGEEQKPIVKGNIDADLVLYAMKEYRNYDKAVIVSGDGDFYGLIEFLAERQKLLRLLTPNQRYSTLLKQFEPYIEGLDQHRGELAYHDRKFGRNGKPKPAASK
ncbi:MAG TPA: NYN domain-containing protein [Candidatus Saccharimonadales bacterium]|nr:NYN domain-containing protein [Candidatus Saccharimonadales bacterium]